MIPYPDRDETPRAAMPAWARVSNMRKYAKRLSSTQPDATSLASRRDDCLINELHRAADRAANFLRAVAHPGRVRILCRLLNGDQTAGDRVRETGLRAPALSQPATILEAQGLIERRRDAQNVWYRLVGPEAKAMARLLHKLFCEPASPTERRRATREALK